MPKHYKEMMDEIINKIEEDAPANAVASGNVDFNATGRNKYSCKAMHRRNSGLETFARWMKKVEEAKKKKFVED